MNAEIYSQKKIPVITLDGPSGTGKGTLCYLLANHLHWHVLDSGSIYRVLAYAALKKGVNFQEIGQLQELARILNLRFEGDDYSHQRVLLDNIDIFQDIRREECGQAASTLAAIPEVREALLERQRAFARAPGLVTDGRDMGTVVFPYAFKKFFLYASEEERAKRRYLQLKKSENDVSLAQVVEELAKRDLRDSSRAVAPLKPAEDAISIDTTGLTVEQVFHNILQSLQDI
jgi:cytidylate kinase